MEQQNTKMYQYLSYFRILVLGMTLFSVLQACGDDYNDTELRNAIEQIENRLKVFEEKMNTEISSLKGMIEGKLTVSSCTYDESTGAYNLLLSDGTSLNIPKNKPSVQLISFIEENGEKYWAIVSASGELKPLTDNEGHKIPVSVVTPALKVNPETHELLISLDGGKSWQGTGAFVNENAESLFTKVESDEKNVYLTLADGTVLTVSKTVNLVCVPLAGKQFFDYGESRLVRVKMQDVKKFMISKPNGWAVNLVDSKLSITAPVKENTYAETAGKVSVVSVAENGQSQIMEIPVVLGEAPLKIAFNEDNVEIKLAEGTSYYSHYLGACSLQEFSPEKICQELAGDADYKKAYYGGTYLLKDLLGTEPVVGEYYIVWSVPVAGYNEEYTTDGFIYECYSSTTATLKVVSTTFEDAMLSIQIAGSDKFYGTVREKSETGLASLLYDLNKGWLSANLINDRQYEGSLMKYGTNYTNALKAGVTYTVYAVPMIEEKEAMVDYMMQYTEKDIFSVDVTINPIVEGGTCTMTFGEVQSQLQSVKTTVLPSSDTYRFYAGYYSEQELAEFANDAVIVKALLDKEAYMDIKPTTLTKEGLSPDAKGCFVAVALSKDGKTGPLAKVEADTKALAFNEAISIKAEIVKLGAKEVTVQLTPVGGDIKTYRYINTTTKNWQNDDPTTEGKLALSDYWNIRETTEQLFVIDRLNSDMEYGLFVLGIDAEGNPTRMTKCVYTPTLDIKIVLKDNPSWNTTKPVLEGLPDAVPEFYMGPVFFDVIPAAGCVKYFVYVDSKRRFMNKDAEALTKFIVTEGDVYEGVQKNLGSQYTSKDALIGIVWVDEADNYYEAELIDPYTGMQVEL